MNQCYDVGFSCQQILMKFLLQHIEKSSCVILIGLSQENSSIFFKDVKIAEKLYARHIPLKTSTTFCDVMK